MGEVVIEKVPLIPSQRFLLTFLISLGTIFVYVVRVNLSVAILCMVRDPVPLGNGTLTNHSAVNGTSLAGFSGDGDTSSAVTPDDQGEFDWDKGTRSRLLAMYFYGYIFTQIPGGYLASRYSGKNVWGFCMFVSALCTLITPISARTNVYVAYAVRFVLGFSAGVTFPCTHALLGHWAPIYERSKMAAVTFAGPMIGNVVTFSISGLLCEYGFDNGWGSIFYLAGGFNMMWVAAWFLLTADTPAKHKRISEKERTFIETSIGRGNIKKVNRVPWLQMFKSGPLWAVISSHVCNNYVNYTLLTSLPTFMKEGLNFDIKANGGLSALPYLCQAMFSILVGYVADTLRERGILTTKSVRKLFQVLSFLGTAACMTGVSQMNRDQRNWAVVLLCLCTSFMGINRAGYVVNHLDLAPSYAGVLFGITNTAATVPGMIAPIIAGALTPNRTPEEWKTVFYVCAAVAATGALIYVVLADGELQSWATSPLESLEMEKYVEAPPRLLVTPPDSPRADDEATQPLQLPTPPLPEDLLASDEKITGETQGSEVVAENGDLAVRP